MKSAFHALLSILTWILFFYWWKKVIPQIGPEDAKTAFLAISLTVLVTSVLTLLWVRHNIAIFRRKGPRKGLPPVSEERSVDHLGRRLDRPAADFLKGARIVTVSLEGGGKRFEIPAAGYLMDERAIVSPNSDKKTIRIPQGA